MKFLIDAQLPQSLKQVFLEKGHDCIHTLDLEFGNDTPDRIINYSCYANLYTLTLRNENA